MKASELYLLKPESTSKCLGVLKGFYYDHLPEIEECLWGLQDKNTKAEIKTLKDFDFDGRRCWSLRTVWFEHHKNFGAFFWLDKDCYKEFPEWWNNEELLEFHDIYYGHKQGDLN